LDTGSGISVISEATAKRLKINPITRGGLARGIGGNGKFEIVYGMLRQIDIGMVRVKNVPVYIRKFQTEGQLVDGYVGLALISKFLTTIDYGDQTFSLTKKDEDKKEFLESSDVSLPLRLTSSGYLSGEVQLQGVEAPLNFIVDTGASVSVISNRVSKSEGISQFASEEKLRIVGSAGVTDDVSTFLLPRVSFGKHTRKSIMAVALDLDVINEASGFEQAGILGGNFLKNYRLTFDFKNSKVTFVSIKPENE
jgi:predicted aspartyl protease